ncbi:MAG: YlxR family protein [Acidimicrobiales bacterium]
MTPKQSPLRTCIGCRRVRPVGELVRVARRPDGSLATGRTLSGRGAWLCDSSVPCLDSAIRRRAFTRAFRSDVDERGLEALRSDFDRHVAGT